mgnify:CR=1 FL=1
MDIRLTDGYQVMMNHHNREHLVRSLAECELWDSSVGSLAWDYMTILVGNSRPSDEEKRILTEILVGQAKILKESKIIIDEEEIQRGFDSYNSEL